ncbi:hypothetical protein EBU94_08040, partial [bacterium]|nr:hypothetical protein [bacterium]
MGQIENNNVWRQTEKNIPPLLKRNIADTLQDLAKDTKLCEIERHSRVSKTLKPDDPKQKDENELHKKNMKIIATAYKTFGSSEFCNGVISFTASYYDDPELEKKIDCNSYVFAFNNGLFDLKTCEFRPIFPSDYISTTCGYDYSKTSNKQTRKLLDNFLFGLFE